MVKQTLIETVDIEIWGRRFSLPVEYDCYKGEEVTDSQKATFNEFVKHKEWIANSKKNVEDFCRQCVSEDTENNKKDNIFSYVKPVSIFVKRDAKNPRIALMCKYRYDPEHGLAIVFSSGGTITVGLQDIIL